MKKSILIVFVAAVVIVSAIVMLSGNKKQTPVINDVVSVDSVTAISQYRRCYSYKQNATVDAPYAVEEYIDITFDGESVIGTKKGTQSGPDMTNGYTGSLEGSVQDDTATLVFSYEIEGSKNKEQEEYLITADSMIKQRYPLLDKGNMLVPDKDKPAKELIYKMIDCQDIEE